MVDNSSEDAADTFLFYFIEQLSNTIIIARN